MATIPEYRRQIGLRAEDQQAISVSTSADTFGAGVGRAMQGAAEGVFKVAQAIDFKDQLTEDARSKEAFGAYRREQREALNAPDTGYLNQTGANGLGVQKPAEDRLRSLRETHAKGLSPRARKKYDDLVDGMQDQAHGQLLTHTSQESRNYIENQRQSTVAGYLEEAATNWNDQELFDKNLGLAMAEQDQLATLQGWDAATRKEGAEKLVSGAMKQRIVQAAAVDPLLAQEMLDNARDALQAGDEYALDTNLKALVIDAKADAAVRPFIKRGGTAGGHGDPYATRVRHAESGNNPFAANNKANPGVASADGRYSSALGLHQYLRGTYLEAVGKMRASGGAAWADGLTPDQIAATRTDEATEGEVHNFVRNENQNTIRSRGFSVTPETEYAFHHFGPAGGTSLLRNVRDNPSAPASAAFGVASPGIIKSNPQFANKTVGEVYDWISKHLGADGSSEPFFDANAAMAAAMAIEDPDVQKAAFDKINNYMTMQDRARGETRSNAQEEAWNQYTETGRTSFDVEMMQNMGQGGWTAFQSAVANDRQGIDETNPETWDMLTTASTDTKAFAEINLEAHRASLSKADWRHFYSTREAAKVAVKDSPLAAAKDRASLPYAKYYEQADVVYNAFVNKTTDAKAGQGELARRVAFQRELAARIGELYDREQREPSEPEVRQLALALALPVVASDTSVFGDGAGTFLFEMAGRDDGVTFEIAKKYKDIPFADRARIASTLSTKTTTPSRREIEDAYEREMMMRAGLPPVITRAEVPKDVADLFMEDYPSATDEEVVESYQLFLMDKFNRERANE